MTSSQVTDPPRESEFTAYFEPIAPPAGDDPEYAYFQPTVAVVSVWSPQIQHGGPPTGLLVRAMEKAVDPGDGQQFSRVTMEILGAIGLGVNRVRTWIPRPGRQISQVCAELEVRGADGTYRSVARTTAWRLRSSDSSAIQDLPRPPLPELPDDLPQNTGFPESVEIPEAWRHMGFIGTVTVAAQPGRLGDSTAVWLRPRLPLVAGEETSDLARAFTVIDVANGLGAGDLDPTRWSWMNTDTTVHLVRQPTGGWVGIDAKMAAGADGYAASFADLYDTSGFVGRSAQTSLLAAVDAG
ncbi:MAG: thioesterase family protein [Gordonia sp. (in: high G+C Gram-positive bacteria)]|uniref:thioesterase family protein n=1 Tax=Gordonia sp. (in: high G+C Gram-positive bacteria) TaxID=84139 RepID=UPI0039E5B5F8